MICVIHKFVCDFVLQFGFVSKSQRLKMENEIQEIKEKIIKTEDKINKVEIDIEQFKLDNHNWKTQSFADYASSLLKDLMQRESDLRKEKLALMEKESDLIKKLDATPQGKTIINHKK